MFALKLLVMSQTVSAVKGIEKIRTIRASLLLMRILISIRMIAVCHGVA